MISKLALAGAAAAVLAAGPALAQPGSAGTQPAPVDPAQSQAQASQYSDADVQAFARATTRLQQMTNAQPEEQAQAVTQAGLSVEKYNEIGQRVQSDPTLRSRVQQALQMAAGAPTGRSGDASTQPDHRKQHPQ